MSTTDKSKSIPDLSWINRVKVHLPTINHIVANLPDSNLLKHENRIAWLLKAVTLIDLTTLGGDDTDSNVTRLCYKAVMPMPLDLNRLLGFNYNKKHITTAAVCVYPAKVKLAATTLKKIKYDITINVASVATGFPSGQYSLGTRIDEIKYAVSAGATEIDVVINRDLVLTGRWELVYEEILQMRQACGTGVHLKVILAAGELGTLTNVYKASMIAMIAGADFIKTSTGKEAINATLQFGVVMALAIRDYYQQTKKMVGLKPAGGIKTSKDALQWLIMVKEILGNEWLDPEKFRFGASGLLLDIEQNLYELATGFSSLPYEFMMG